MSTQSCIPTATEFRNLWLQDLFKDQLKLIVDTFTFERTHTVRFSTDNVLTKMEREDDDKMTFTVFAEGFDNNYEIYSATFYNTSAVSYSPTTIYLGSKADDDVITTFYNKDNLDRIHLLKRDGYQFIECHLDYPFKEEQLFQQMTRFPVPEIDYMEYFFKTSQYVLGGSSDFWIYSFHCGWISGNINETNKENMVQSIQESIDGLIREEQIRLQAE